jgi:hypothetical protein
MTAFVGTVPPTRASWINSIDDGAFDNDENKINEHINYAGSTKTMRSHKQLFG